MKKNTEGDDMVMEQKYEMGGKMLLHFFFKVLRSSEKLCILSQKYSFSL